MLIIGGLTGDFAFFIGTLLSLSSAVVGSRVGNPYTGAVDDSDCA